VAREIYVGHLSADATEEDIRKLFSVAGPVTSVHLIYDRESGEFKRCGYVRMAPGVDLDEVVETLDDAYLIDRQIAVSIARPQKPGISSGKTAGYRKPSVKPREAGCPGKFPLSRSGAPGKAGGDETGRPGKAADGGNKGPADRAGRGRRKIR